MDRYTKVMLTLIAGALVGLALEHATPQARAQDVRAICGDMVNPCYIKVAGPVTLER